MWALESVYHAIRHYLFVLVRMPVFRAKGPFFGWLREGENLVITAPLAACCTSSTNDAASTALFQPTGSTDASTRIYPSVGLALDLLPGRLPGVSIFALAFVRLLAGLAVAPLARLNAASFHDGSCLSVVMWRERWWSHYSPVDHGVLHQATAVAVIIVKHLSAWLYRTTNNERMQAFIYS